MDVALSSSQLTGLPAMAWAWTVAFAPRVFAALLIIGVGVVCSRWIRKAIVGITGRSHRFDPTLRPVLITVVQYTIFIFILLLVLNQLGIQTTSLLTILGAAGLAVGLALQGTLSNIAAGIMLLWLRPFKLGDYIEVNNMAGTVEETGLFACIIRTYDGARVFAPNSTLWNFSMRNNTRTDTRLVAISTTVEVSKEGTARDTLQKAMASNMLIRKAPVPIIFLDQSTDTTVTLTCRFWTAHKDYGEAQRTLIDTFRGALLGAGMEPADIRLIVRVTPVPADPTRLMDMRG